MIVFILIAIIGFILFVVIANVSFFFLSYWISLFFGAFAEKNRKLIQGLSQSAILLTVTIFLFVFSYKGCTYSNGYGINNDNAPVIGGWFLLLTGLILVCVTFVVFIFAFDDPEKQKAIEAEKIAEARIKESKKEAQAIHFFREKSDLFSVSPEYKYIEQFGKKFGANIPGGEIGKLKDLLKQRQWDFSSQEVENLVRVENWRRFSNEVKERILSHTPHGGREIVESYLLHFQSNDDKAIEALSELLDERGLFTLFEGNIEELKREVRKVEKEIELEHFEKRLSEENEQVRIDQIDSLTGYEFEEFLGELFLRMGYSVEQTKLSGDQGADLVAVKFGEKTIVQAKRFGAKVGNKAVQEIVAAMNLYRAQKGMVITNNYFTVSAIELANSNSIELVDRDSLEELIQNHW